MEYKPHPKQLAAHNCGKNRVILNWGRQTGKSVFAINHTWIEAVKKQGRYFIVLPTYQQAYDTFWVQYLGFIPEGLISKSNEQRLTITLNYIKGDITLPNGEKMYVEHDTTLPPSRIELKGSDKADNLRGSKVNGFVFDEYAIHKPNAYTEVFEPMMSTTDGWAIFISSPRGFNHFYELWDYAERHPEEWHSSHATPYDNPEVSKSFIQGIKEKAEETGNTNRFYQEYMAEFRQMEGLVYPEFDRKTHIVPPSKVPQVGTRVAGIDFGYTNPTAVVFILIDYDGNWWVYDELYERKKTMNDIIKILEEKTKDHRITIMAGDSAQPEHIANLGQNSKIPIVPVKKTRDAIPEGISLVAELMKPREQLTGPPKPKFFVSSTCVNFVEEIQQYRYPEKKDGKNPNEDPIKEHDHLMDATRYIRLFMTHDVNEEYDFPEEELFNEGGFYV